MTGRQVRAGAGIPSFRGLREDTGIKKYRYIRTAENHFSMAFTYAWMAAMDRLRAGVW